jgi:hypothetical protein
MSLYTHTLYTFYIGWNSSEEVLPAEFPNFLLYVFLQLFFRMGVRPVDFVLQITP